MNILFLQKNKVLLQKIVAILLLFVLVFGMAAVTHAQSGSGATSDKSGGTTSWIQIGLGPLLSLLANFALILNNLAGWFLTLCGYLLNVSMHITVNLQAFIQATPVIYTVWSTIRDLASLFLIFAILMAAIQMILDISPANFGSIIKQIVIAGVLINFSFFFAQVLIDFSNVVSLQFYNAIAPNNTITYTAGSSIGDVVKAAVTDGTGGISGTFMSALKLSTWSGKNYGQIAYLKDLNSWSQDLNLLIINYTAAIVQMLAGLSFVAAALANLWRTVTLIFLLGFSSVWIAAYAVPQLKTARDKWWKMFKQNLIFLPVYLIFMYVALLFIGNSNLSSIAGTLAASTTPLNTFIILTITAAIMLFFINLPLFVAISIAGAPLDITKKISDWSWNYMMRGTTAYTAGKGLAGYGAKRTIGAGAAALDKKIGGTVAGNYLIAQNLRKATLGKVAGAKFGTSTSYVDYAKAQKEAGKKRAEIGKRNEKLEGLRAATTTDEYKKILDTMKPGERVKLGKDFLTKPEVLKHFNKSNFEDIKKADENDISEEVKDEIKKKRTEAFADAVSKNESSIVKNMMKAYETDDIIKYLNDKDNDFKTNPIPDVVIANLTDGALREINKGNDLDVDIKKKVGRDILRWSATHPNIHMAEKFIRNNRATWT